MPLSRSRDYLSIGEVLEAIRPEFPDVSISKIRFLENEGLIEPERTASGYRKFYDPDVARLRYVLALQRDQFLPLRVIRERLAQWDGAEAADARAAPAGAQEAEATAPEDRDARLTRAELLAAAGIDEHHAAGLEEFSILAGRGERFGADDVAIAKAAVALFAYGLEPRHLRMFRQAADREAALVDQIVAPIARKRDPQARREAADAARALVARGGALRAALLRARLRELL